MTPPVPDAVDGRKDEVVEKAVKFDAGKLRYSLLPRVSVEEIVRVLMFGSQKYSDNNWMLLFDRPDGKERYYNAAMRHLTAWWSGERNDPESGLHHLGHVGACIVFLLWHEADEHTR
jgi:hypothetical protein